MSIDIILYMLMFIALAGVIIMAVIVNVRLSKIKKLEQPESAQKQEPVVDEVEATKPDIIEEEPEPAFGLEPEYKVEPEPYIEPQVDTVLPLQPEHEPEIEAVSEETPEMEPIVDLDDNQETELDNNELEEIEQQEIEIPPELRVEPEKENFIEEESRKEPSSPFFEMRGEEKVEETVDLEMPFYFEISPGTEEKPEEVVPEETQTEEEWYVPEEPVDETKKKEEDDDGIVVCPHCSSEVPKTIYCIYCGNSLKPNPLVEEP